MKNAIQTERAPAAIGPYSQAIKIGNTVYLSGQIPLNPVNQDLVKGDMTAQATQVFENLKAVAEAAGGSLDSIVRISIYLTDLTHFPVVNEVMKQYFKAPFPARSTIGVTELPKGAAVEADAIMVI